MEIAEVVDIHRNQSQRTGVEATGEEVIIIRHLEKVSSMTIRVQMATLSLNSIKGSVIQREEEPTNRINESGRIVKELQFHCNRVTSLTVMQWDAVSMTTLYSVLLGQMIQTDAVKETEGDLEIVVTEGVVGEE